jgi:hypothetical protein
MTKSHRISVDTFTGHLFVAFCCVVFLSLLLLALHVSNVNGNVADAIEFVVAILVLPIANVITYGIVQPVPVSCLFPRSIPPKSSNKASYFVEIGTLLFFLSALPILYFDFSLSVEPLHYLTNLAPAFHIHNGGILLSDTFSQYGPGPTVATYLTGLLYGFSFGTANMVVQLFNIIFYILIVAVTFVSCRSKPWVLLVPILIIGAMLSVWGANESNINIAPSTLGFRYLPALTLVLAITLLPPNRSHSALSVFALVFASIWSIEALFGTVLIQLGFIAGINLRDRNFAKLIQDTSITLLICLASILVLGVAIWFWAGTTIDLFKYIGFLSVYNPLSDYWAKPSGLNLSWYSLLLIFIHINTIILIHIFFKINTKNHLLYNVILPVLLFSIFCSIYYKSRSVDYTLSIVYPPISILLSLAIVYFLSLVPNRFRIKISIVLLSLFVFTAYYNFSSLYHKKSNYSFLLHQCRDEQRCSLPKLVHGLQITLAKKPVLEPVGNQWSDYRLDNKNILQDAVSIIENNVFENSNPTVLLGKVQHISYLSDLALFYSKRWHNWPRSFTFTDELVPSIHSSILAFSPQKMTEQLVVVRKDKSSLEIVESGIWVKLQSGYQLCPLKVESLMLEAYKTCGLK